MERVQNVFLLWPQYKDDWHSVGVTCINDFLVFGYQHSNHSNWGFRDYRHSLATVFETGHVPYHPHSLQHAIRILRTIRRYMQRKHDSLNNKQSLQMYRALPRMHYNRGNYKFMSH